MKSIYGLLITFLSICFGCNDKYANADSDSANKKFTQTFIQEENKTPTIDINNYRLITDGTESHKADAKEILTTKRNWPLAMQTKDSVLFNSILSKNFTFSGGSHIYNRADYIADRITPSSWKITHVTYENMALQFFGEYALLTYKNIVENKDSSGAVEIEHITWADMYVKENGKWKIRAAHVIDFSVGNPDTLRIK